MYYAEEISGVDGKTPGMDDDHFSKATPDEIEGESTERTSGGMNLRRQPHKDQNRND